jgi:competence protein ComEC
MLGIDQASCGGMGAWRDLGRIAIQREAAPGERFVATGWLVPVTLDSAAARAGAGANLQASRFETSSADDLRVSFRSSLARSAGASMGASQAALLRGLVIGDKAAIGAADLAALRVTGLTHLVAVSGSNVAIVAGVALVALRRAGPRVSIPVAAAMLVAYVWIVGADPSVLRAAAMGGITIAGLIWGTRPEPITALGAAVILVLAVRPGLVVALGLHLSVAAVAGMVLLTGRIERVLHVLPRLIRIPLAASVAAQIAVAPLLAAAFGTVSLIAPVTNLAAAVAVAPATVTGLAAGALGWMHPRLGEMAAAVARPFVGWILSVARWGAGVSWALVEVTPLQTAVLGIFVCAVMVSAVVTRGRPTRLGR